MLTRPGTGPDSAGGPAGDAGPGTSVPAAATSSPALPGPVTPSTAAAVSIAAPLPAATPAAATGQILCPPLPQPCPLFIAARNGSLSVFGDIYSSLLPVP